MNLQGDSGTDGEKGEPGEPGSRGLPGKNVREIEPPPRFTAGLNNF